MQHAKPRESESLEESMRNTDRLLTKAIKKTSATDATRNPMFSWYKSAKLKLSHRRIGHSTGWED
ncbi:hypothetical protein ACSS6W_001037 [Trichoderma asperelloides]